MNSTHFTFNYAMASRHFREPDYRLPLSHGLAFPRDVHRDPATGGYAWMLDWDGQYKTVIHGEHNCYRLACVRLAHAHGLAGGVAKVRVWGGETWDLMEGRFWEPEHGRYAEQATADSSELDLYLCAQRWQASRAASGRLANGGQ